MLMLICMEAPLSHRSHSSHLVHQHQHQLLLNIYEQYQHKQQSALYRPDHIYVFTEVLMNNGIRDACSTADIFNGCSSGLVVG